MVQGPARGLELRRMPSDFDQAGWLLNHTALPNEQRQRWEQQGYSALTEGQNSFNLRGSSAVLAGKPDLVAQAQRRDHRHRRQDRPPQSGPRHTGIDLHERPASCLGTLPGTEHRRPSGLPRPRGRHPGRCGRREVSSRTWAALSAAWRRNCRPGGCPARGSAGSVRSRRPTAPTGRTTDLWRRALPTTSDEHWTPRSGERWKH